MISSPARPIFLSPNLRNKLAVSRRCIKTWENVVPKTSATPLTQDLINAFTIRLHESEELLCAERCGNGSGSGMGGMFSFKRSTGIGMGRDTPSGGLQAQSRWQIRSWSNYLWSRDRQSTNSAHLNRICYKKAAVLCIKPSENCSSRAFCKKL